MQTVNSKDSELVRANKILANTQKAIDMLKCVNLQIYQVDLKHEISKTISILEMCKSYIEILLKYPKLLKSDFDQKPVVNLSKILDHEGLQIFFEKNSDIISQTGLLEIEQVFLVANKVLNQIEISSKIIVTV